MITTIQDSHTSSILQLCDDAFGINFITLEYLKEHINSKHYKAFVLIEDNIVIGFVSIHLHTSSSLKNEVLKEFDWFLSEVNNAKTIGLIKQVIIHPKYQKRGFALELIKHCITLFKNNVDLFLCIAWVTQGFTPLKNTLINTQFKLKKIINNYWSEDSSCKQYDCPACNASPCECSAEVYFLIGQTYKKSRLRNT